MRYLVRSILLATLFLAASILNLPVRADGTDGPDTAVPSSETEDTYRTDAHSCLSGFMRLYRQGDADSRQQLVEYLDVSELPGDDLDNAPTLALRLGEFLQHRKLATNAKFEELRSQGSRIEHCLLEQETGEQLGCLVRLVRQPDGLWQFDARTVKSIALLAAQDDVSGAPKSDATSAAPASERVIAEPSHQVPETFASPQATMETFLKAHQAKDAMKAAACLDLSEYTGIQAHDRQARLLADALKFVLDRTVYVKVLELPESPATPSPYVYRVVGNWNISLRRLDDGRWLFSSKTLADLPEMCRAVAKDAPKVPYARKFSFKEMPELWVFLNLPAAVQGAVGALRIWQWIGLCLLVLLGWLADRISRLVIRAILHLLLRRLKGRSDARLEEGALRPIGFLAMGIAWLHLLPYLWLPSVWGNVSTTTVWFIIIVSAIWATWRGIDLAAGYLLIVAERTPSKFDEMLVPFGRKLCKVLVTIGGVVYFAGRLFPDNFQTLLGGLGLGGLAFALAAQDTLKNLFGSLTVMIDRPFEVGDWVKIGDAEGTVETVGFRSTRIRTFYNSQIYIPNCKLIDATVDNMGRRAYRRISCRLGITYDTPPEKIEAFCEGIRELIRRHPHTRKDYYHVYFNGFGASALEMLLYCFHKVPDWSTELRERHRLFLDILRLARHLGVDFAFPTQTLHVHNADNAEPNVPPEPPRAFQMPVELVGRSEAAAITKATMPADDALGPVKTELHPQPVDEEYVDQRSRDFQPGWPGSRRQP